MGRLEEQARTDEFNRNVIEQARRLFFERYKSAQEPHEMTFRECLQEAASVERAILSVLDEEFALTENGGANV